MRPMVALRFTVDCRSMERPDKGGKTGHVVERLLCGWCGNRAKQLHPHDAQAGELPARRSHPALPLRTNRSGR